MNYSQSCTCRLRMSSPIWLWNVILQLQFLVVKYLFFFYSLSWTLAMDCYIWIKRVGVRMIFWRCRRETYVEYGITDRCDCVCSLISVLKFYAEFTFLFLWIVKQLGLVLYQSFQGYGFVALSLLCSITILFMLSLYAEVRLGVCNLRSRIGHAWSLSRYAYRKRSTGHKPKVNGKQIPSVEV